MLLDAENLLLLKKLTITAKEQHWNKRQTSRNFQFLISFEHQYHFLDQCILFLKINMEARKYSKLKRKSPEKGFQYSTRADEILEYLKFPAFQISNIKKCPKE